MKKICFLSCCLSFIFIFISCDFIWERDNVSVLFRQQEIENDDEETAGEETAGDEEIAVDSEATESEVKENGEADSDLIDASEAENGGEEADDGSSGTIEEEEAENGNSETIEEEEADDGNKEKNECEDSESGVEDENNSDGSESAVTAAETSVEIFDGSNLTVNEDRVWTILVYMSADNKLESAALEDLCEMQRANINASKITLLALVDRSEGYNSSNGDWAGTRLYKISTGKSAETKELVSEEIDCKTLGLSIGKETELEMSSSDTLSGVLSYVIKKFPAEKYGLIMWGHGTGWRDLGTEENSCNSTQLYKGFAYDETSGNYMTLKQLGTGLSAGLGGIKLNFIGFDTCFGGELEVVYELRNYGLYFAGSEGLIASSGWNYEKLLDYFEESADLSEESLCSGIVKQFSEQYEYTSRASICAVNLEKVEACASAFTEFCLMTGKSIKSTKTRDAVMDVVYSGAECTTEKYTFGAAGYDIYLDTTSMVENVALYFSTLTLKKLSNAFYEAEKEAVIESWASDRERGGLGVYFSTLAAGGILSSNHPSGYVKNKAVNQIDFVMDFTGYVPEKVTSYSLLDSLFYREFL